MPRNHLDYAPHASDADQANRIYNVLLLVLAFFFAMGIGSIVFVMRLPTRQPDPAADWVFRFVLYVNGLYLAAIVLTILLRFLAPSAGRIASKALNVILLFAIPFGTAVGLYGLWKADKRRGAEA